MVVDGSVSNWFDVVSSVPQGSVLGPLLFVLYTSEMFELVQNNLFAYADDSSLVAIVPTPESRSAVVATINSDLCISHK